jgi:hypothetical protein
MEPKLGENHIHGWWPYTRMQDRLKEEKFVAPPTISPTVRPMLLRRKTLLEHIMHSNELKMLNYS